MIDGCGPSGVLVIVFTAAVRSVLLQVIGAEGVLITAAGVSGTSATH